MTPWHDLPQVCHRSFICAIPHNAYYSFAVKLVWHSRLKFHPNLFWELGLWSVISSCTSRNSLQLGHSGSKQYGDACGCCCFICLSVGCGVMAGYRLSFRSSNLLPTLNASLSKIE